MKTSHKFGFRFDACLLEKDLDMIVVEWKTHFNAGHYEGEWSGVPLPKPVSKFHGLSTENEKTEYQNNQLLKEPTYFKEILESFQCEKTSARLLRLSPGAIIKEHCDEHFSFFQGNVRLHIPILTNDRVEFVVDGENLPMEAGECWFAEFCEPHLVDNCGFTDQVHLVIDLKVNDWLTNLFEEEEIIKPGEQAPKPANDFPTHVKVKKSERLSSENTTTSALIAQNMIKKHILS